MKLSVTAKEFIVGFGLISTVVGSLSLGTWVSVVVALFVIAACMGVIVYLVSVVVGVVVIDICRETMCSLRNNRIFGSVV